MARKKTKTVASTEFRQECLALLDEVAERRTEFVITRRGKPIARLVPMQDRKPTEAQPRRPKPRASPKGRGSVLRPQTDREREEAILAKLRAGARILVNDEELLKPLW